MCDYTQTLSDMPPKNILEKLEIIYDIEVDSTEDSKEHDGYLKGLHKSMEIIKNDDLDSNAPKHKYRCFHTGDDLIIDLEAHDLLGVIGQLHNDCYDYNKFYRIEQLD